MPRPPRSDEAGGLYHALNRGNSRAAIFRKDADFEAFENLLAEAVSPSWLYSTTRAKQEASFGLHCQPDGITRCATTMPAKKFQGGLEGNTVLLQQFATTTLLPPFHNLKTY